MTAYEPSTPFLLSMGLTVAIITVIVSIGFR